jgi:hypothetical protein
VPASNPTFLYPEVLFLLLFFHIHSGVPNFSIIFTISALHRSFLIVWHLWISSVLALQQISLFLIGCSHTFFDKV